MKIRTRNIISTIGILMIIFSFYYLTIKPYGAIWIMTIGLILAFAPL